MNYRTICSSSSSISDHFPAHYRRKKQDSKIWAGLFFTDPQYWAEQVLTTIQSVGSVRLWSDQSWCMWILSASAWSSPKSFYHSQRYKWTKWKFYISPLEEKVTKGQEGWQALKSSVNIAFITVCVDKLSFYYFLHSHKVKKYLIIIQNIACICCQVYDKCVCVCVGEHSTFRGQTSASQGAHFPNVNISVKTWRVRVNRILLNCERLRAPLSPRWLRARQGNQPLPPSFLKHCPFIKEEPPTTFLNHNIPSLLRIPRERRRLFVEAV